MKLPDFIDFNLEALTNDWAEYARVLSRGDHWLSESASRDSGRELLRQIAENMRGAQTALQREDKSHGAKDQSDTAFDAVSVSHADDRLTQGFAVNDVIAEYRALRASVLRRWQRSEPIGNDAFEEMIRFNEAIDQAVAESVRRFALRTERIRDLFAGVLAHDLRSPLGAIVNSTDVLLRDENLSSRSVKATANMQRSAVRMKAMLDDLLVFARTRLGDALPVSFSPQNISRICSDAIEEVRALYPNAIIELSCSGVLAGRWDGGRICQLLVNLLSNGVRYGSGPIRVEAFGGDAQITLSVANEGQPIPAHALPTLFDPLTRINPSSEGDGVAAGMGLGLYICRCIAIAHDGNIRVDTTERGTTFTVQMPQRVGTSNWSDG